MKLAPMDEDGEGLEAGERRNRLKKRPTEAKLLTKRRRNDAGEPDAEATARRTIRPRNQRRAAPNTEVNPASRAGDRVTMKRRRRRSARDAYLTEKLHHGRVIDSRTKRRYLLAVRIYSLAKELKFDSKELVDICTKAGVPGKGSALASLTEEEVEKVQAVPQERRHRQSEAGESRSRGAAATDRARTRRQDAGDRHAEAGRSDCATETGRARTEAVKRRRAARAEAPLAATSRRSKRPSRWRRRVARPVGRRDGPRKIHWPRYRDRQSARRRRRKHGRPSERKPTGARRTNPPGRQARADAEVAATELRSRPPTNRPLKSPTCACQPICWVPESKAASRWPRTSSVTSARSKKKRSSAV